MSDPTADQQAQMIDRASRVEEIQRFGFARGALIHAFARHFGQEEIGRMFDETGEPGFPDSASWRTVADALGEAWSSYGELNAWAVAEGLECPVGVHDARGCRA